jgi:hypothetical protein
MGLVLRRVIPLIHTRGDVEFVLVKVRQDIEDEIEAYYRKNGD